MSDPNTPRTDEASVRNAKYRQQIRDLGGGTAVTAEGLDQMLAVGEECLAHALACAAKAKSGGNTAESDRWTDEANISLYNLSANLCDCWGDGDSRAPRHFAAGLAFADRALALRHQLKKGGRPMAMAHWVRGKHLLSLKRPAEAVEAFKASLAHQEKMGQGADKGADDHMHEGLWLARGFLAIAELRTAMAALQGSDLAPQLAESLRLN